MLPELLKLRQEVLNNQFSSLGRPFLDGFQMAIYPPWSDYSEDEVIRFEVTSVAVVILVEFEGEQWIYLTRQADREGNPWELPSGKVDPTDKTPEHTARRETLEELGIELGVIKPLTYGWKSKSNKGGLQYLTRMKLDHLDILNRTDNHIFLKLPDNVDPSEISEICLERYNLDGKSLLHTSAHPWAYKRTFGALEQRLEG